MNRYIYIFSLLFLLGYGCSNDNGNYDYKDLNKITVDSIKDLYSVIRYDNIEPITPTLNFSISKTEDVSYTWKVNYKVVSDKPILDVMIDAPLGTQAAALIVTDNETGVQYFKEFKIKVTTSYSNGILLLSERTDGSAMLSYQRRDKADFPFQPDVFEEVNPRHGKLGDNPTQVIESGNMQGKHFYYILCKNGEKKITTLDVNTLEMTKIDNETTVSGGYTGDFHPTQITQSASGGCVISEGKLFTYNIFSSGNLYRPVAGDYYLNWTDFNQMYGAYAQFGYDQISQKFMIFTTGADTYTYDIVNSYEKIDGFEGTVINTTDQEFVAAGATGQPYVMEEKKVILRNKSEDRAYFYTFNVGVDLPGPTYDALMGKPPYGVTLNQTIDNLITDNSVCAFAPLNRYWYIANGREITRMFWNAGTTSKVFTLPAEIKGNITAIAFDEEENEMYVGIYDPNSTNTHKGSIVVMHPEEGTVLEVVSNAGEKPVSIFRKE